VWNALAIVAIVELARMGRRGPAWEFAHDWLPLVFFVSVFEEVSFLALTIRGGWQNQSLIALESSLFSVAPTLWLRQHLAPRFAELLEFGYFTFYPLYPIVGGVLWAWRDRSRYTGGFRRLTDSLSVGYISCYLVYLLYPIRSPLHNASFAGQNAASSGGVFHAVVGMIQGRAGVHGNAFPSAHIMLAFVVLVVVFRNLPRMTPPVSACVLLMCIGAVYDGYHYAIDVIAGALVGLAVAVAFMSERTGSNP